MPPDNVTYYHSLMASKHTYKMFSWFYITQINFWDNQFLKVTDDIE